MADQRDGYAPVISLEWDLAKSSGENSEDHRYTGQRLTYGYGNNDPRYSRVVELCRLVLTIVALV